MKLASSVVCIGALIATSTVASAQVFYQAEYSFIGGFGGSFGDFEAGNLPVQTSNGQASLISPGVGSASAFAFAGGTLAAPVLGVKSRLAVTQFGVDSGSIVAEAKAKFEVFDLVFSGPTSTVNVIVPFVISGAFSEVQGSTTSPIIPPYTGLTSTVTIAGQSSRGDLVIEGPSLVPPTGYGDLSGTFSSTSISSREFYSSVFTVPTGVPLQFSWQLTSTTAVYGTSITSYRGMSDFANTGSLRLQGSTFVLPEGYTANSNSLGITDNTIPSAGTLWSLGPALFITVRRRRA